MPGHQGKILGDMAHFQGEAEMLFPTNTRLMVKDVATLGTPQFKEKINEIRLSDDASSDKTKIKRIIDLNMFNGMKIEP